MDVVKIDLNKYNLFKDLAHDSLEWRNFGMEKLNLCSRP